MAHVVVLASALAGTGCPGPGDEPPPDATTSTGLVITWTTKPASLPGEGPSDSRIDSAVLRLANLRLVGDADPHPVGALVLEWRGGGKPMPLVVHDAPSGLYSRCIFDLAGTPYAYELTGTARVGGVSEPFTIRDAAAHPIAVEYSVMLPPGGSAAVAIEVDLARLVGVVDFPQVPLVDGRRVVEDGSPELERVRDELADAFEGEPK